MADSPFSSTLSGDRLTGREPRSVAFDDALRLGLWTVLGVFVALSVIGIADTFNDLRIGQSVWLRIGTHLGLGVFAGAIVTILRGFSRRKWEIGPRTLTLKGWGRRDGTYAVTAFYLEREGPQASLIATVERGFDAVLTRGPTDELDALLRTARATYDA